jgi:hypothetical protein
VEQQSGEDDVRFIRWSKPFEIGVLVFEFFWVVLFAFIGVGLLFGGLLAAGVMALALMAVFVFLLVAGIMEVVVHPDGTVDLRGWLHRRHSSADRVSTVKLTTGRFGDDAGVDSCTIRFGRRKVRLPCNRSVEEVVDRLVSLNPSIVVCDKRRTR